MDITGNIIEELSVLRDNLQHDRLSVEAALKKLSECNELSAKLSSGPDNVENIIQKLFITFNVSCLSEATLLIRTDGDTYEIIEAAGTGLYIEYIKEQLADDSGFYKDLRTVTVRGITSKIFHETMITGNRNYTLITVSESVIFKPSKFHMLSDIIMDLIRADVAETRSLYNDIFENVIIEINNLILSQDNEIHSIFLFKFEYMPVFIENIGIASIVELSDYVLGKLGELFGDDVKIFRISLARFLIIFKKNNYGYENFVNYQRKGKFDFNYRGIVLPHYHSSISYDQSKTIYDIFENIFTIEKGMISDSIAI